MTGALAAALSISMVPTFAVAQETESQGEAQVEVSATEAAELVKSEGQLDAEAEAFVKAETIPETEANLAEAEETANVEENFEEAVMLRATTSNNLAPVDATDISDIAISGANVESYTVETTNSNNGNDGNKTYTYNIVLEAGTPLTAEVTATFTKVANSGCIISKMPRTGGLLHTKRKVKANKSLVYPIALQGGEATANAYLFPDLTWHYTRFDTYKFVYTVAETQQVSIGFGDPQFPPTSPEKDMVLTGDAPNFTATYQGDLQGYYPNILTVRIEGNTSLTTENGGTDKVCFVEYDAQGKPTELATPTNQAARLYTVKIKEKGKIKINGNVFVEFLNPANPTPQGDGFPTAFKGYLPLGQFATGSSWGSPYVEGTTPKVVGGAAGGMSLGAAGGYAEYEMLVKNNPNNKYGIDFMVYGNAFIGNPEAGSVKVFGTPVGGTEGWYELAGSRYYDDETLRNVDVSYKVAGGKLQYKVTDGNNSGAAPLQDWKDFGPESWMPAADKYDNVKGNVDDVEANLAGKQITYKNLTLVRDTDTNADYAFGYFDVAPNGACDDNAVNPYLAGSNGANGFDLSWAVDKDGNPVDLQEITKIRVYTSAALEIDTPNAVADFAEPSIFGETSAELDKIVKAKANGTSVGVTSEPSVIKVNNRNISDFINEVSAEIEQISTNIKLCTISAEALPTSFNVNVTATGNMYINDEMTASKIFSKTTQKYIRIIVQDGDKEPQITIIKIDG